MMRFGSTVVPFLAFLLAAPLVAQTESTRSASEESPLAERAAQAAYEKAVRLFNKKDYARADKELAACLERLPAYSDAHLLWAKSLYARKDYAGALVHAREAEATFPASVALRQRRHDDSVAEMQRRRRALDDQLREYTSMLGRATTLDERQRIETVIARAEQERTELERRVFVAPELPPGMPAEYPFFHGNVLLRLQRWDEAAAKYKEALALQPAYPEATNNLAALYLAAKRPQLALTVIEQAETQKVSVDPELKRAVLDALHR